MDNFIKRSQNPKQQPAMSSTPHAEAHAHGSFHGHRRQGGIARIIAMLVVLVIVVGGGFFAFRQLTAKNEFAQAVNKDKFQAVFLTNNQVYFGKIEKISSTGYTIKNIYYLQVQQGVQPETKKEGEDQNISLAKLGSELHGPDDVMYIENKQVMFWENLKDDSQVVKAIQNNQKK